jgi:hypothetical protein
MAVVLGAAACGNVGSVASAKAGRVRTLLDNVVRTGSDESVLTGLAVSPDGTVYLGVVDQPGYRDEKRGRILELRPGRPPKIILRENDRAIRDLSLDTKFLAVGKDGELLVVAYGDSRVKIVTRSRRGDVRTVDGPRFDDDTAGFVFDVTALAANPGTGDVYIADSCRIGRLDTGGRFEVILGTQTGVRCGTPEMRTVPDVIQEIFGVEGLAVDPGSGALYFGTEYPSRVMRLDGNAVTVLAGRQIERATGGDSGFYGDGGPAREARLDSPGRMAFDVATSDLYFNDNANKRIRRIDRSGTITTVLGDGTWRGPFEGAPTDVSVDAAQMGLDSRGRIYATARHQHYTGEPYARRLVVASIRPS